MAASLSSYASEHPQDLSPLFSVSQKLDESPLGPGAVLGAGDTRVTKTGPVPAISGSMGLQNWAIQKEGLAGKGLASLWRQPVH